MYGPVIAEHVFAMMLSHTRSLPQYLDADRRGEWDRSPAGTMTALQGGTMLVVGLGGIGSEIAMRAVRNARPHRTSMSSARPLTWTGCSRRPTS
jgi:phosphoglycerate dehydrogenase-like enzyme